VLAALAANELAALFSPAPGKPSATRVS
jgi:hypothetical protein